MKIALRTFVLIGFLAISVWYFLSPTLFEREGVKVIAIGEKASCGNMKVGDIIMQMSGRFVYSKQEFEDALKYVKAGDRVSFVLNGGPGGCTAFNDGDLGIEVVDIRSDVLEFGIDLVGGDRFLLSSPSALSQGDISYISSVLERRLNVAGLQDSKVVPEEGGISIYTPSGTDVSSVLINGRFECFIEQELKLTNSAAKLMVGNNTYEIIYNTTGNLSAIVFDGKLYNVGDVFDVGGVRFKLANATNETLVVDALVFENSDISKVAGSTSYVNYESTAGRYQFNIPIDVSEAAGERFSSITEGLIPLYGTGGDLLNGLLIYVLDGNEVSRLSIPSNMAGSPIKVISIIGGGAIMEEAVGKKMAVDISLEGKLEKKIFIKSAESFSGVLGWAVLLWGIVIASVVAATFLIVTIRYRILKGGLVAAVIIVLEMVYILGVVSISQSFGSRWVLDFASMLGLWIFLFLSVVQTIFLSEKALKGRVFKRHKHFVHLVFIASFLLLFTPVSRTGLVLIVGWGISVILTKPAYNDFLSGLR